MERHTLILLSLLLLLAAAALAQGGKAEPRRIAAEAARSGTVLAGTLRHGQEMEYAFGGEKGEVAAFRNPKPSLFDVRVYETASEFDTEYDSSRTFEVDLPERAEYIIYIRRKVGGPRAARFSVSFRVRRS